jgi:precorrin-6B methylase 2
MRDINLVREIFNKVYEGYDGYKIYSQEKEKLNLNKTSFIYGEIIFDEFVELLKKVNPQKDDIFYDLGSGLGKPCLAISLAFEIKKAVGVELLPDFIKASREVYEKTKEIFPEINEVEFREENFLETNLEEATIIFLHATCFDEKEMEKIEESLLKLKKESRIIVITKSLKNSKFLLLEEGSIKMNWGTATFRIYHKK